MKMRKIKPYLRKLKRDLKQYIRGYYNQPNVVYICDDTIEYCKMEINIPE